MIIRLGMNPKSAGRHPPTDSVSIRMSEVIRGVLLHVCDRDNVVVAELCMSTMKVANVAVI